MTTPRISGALFKTMSKIILNSALFISVMLTIAGCQAGPNVLTNDQPSPQPTPAVSPAPSPPDPTLQNDGLDDALHELEAVE